MKPRNWIFGALGGLLGALLGLWVQARSPGWDWYWYYAMNPPAASGIRDEIAYIFKPPVLWGLVLGAAIGAIFLPRVAKGPDWAAMGWKRIVTITLAGGLLGSVASTISDAATFQAVASVFAGRVALQDMATQSYALHFFGHVLPGLIVGGTLSVLCLAGIDTAEKAQRTIVGALAGMVLGIVPGFCLINLIAFFALVGTSTYKTFAITYPALALGGSALFTMVDSFAGHEKDSRLRRFLTPALGGLLGAVLAVVLPAFS
jgi:hypothetical protein